MANENAGAEGATENTGPTDQQEMDKFAGFAVKDGEVIKPAAPAKQNANAKPLAGKAAVKAEDAAADADDDDAAQDGKHASANDRIGQAVGRQRAAERRATKAESELGTMKERLARLEGVAQGGALTANANKSSKAPKAPNPKDYEGGEYDTKYLSDLVDFRVDQKVAAATSKVTQDSRQEAATAEQQRQLAAFTKARDDFAAKASEDYPDFEEVVFDNANPVSRVLADLSVDSEHGARILYELAEDHKEAVRVSKLSPARQAAWFGRQEAALEDSSDDTDAGNDDGGDGEQERRSSARQSGPKTRVSKAPSVPDYNARGTGAVPKTNAATTDFAAFERMATPARK